jgi:hypothetical protein
LKETSRLSDPGKCGKPLCANMSETTLSFFKVEGTESLYDRNGQRKS